MGKNSWIALLLALVVLVTTVPACASEAVSLSVSTYSEEDYGGLAPPPAKTESSAGTRTGMPGRSCWTAWRRISPCRTIGARGWPWGRRGASMPCSGNPEAVQG